MIAANENEANAQSSDGLIEGGDTLPPDAPSPDKPSPDAAPPADPSPSPVSHVEPLPDAVRPGPGADAVAGSAPRAAAAANRSNPSYGNNVAGPTFIMTVERVPTEVRPGAYAVGEPGAAEAAAAANRNIPGDNDDIVLEGFLPPEQSETRDQRLRREVQEMMDNAVLLDDSAVRALPMESDRPAPGADASEDGDPPVGDGGDGGNGERARPAAKALLESPFVFVAGTVLLLAAIALGATFGGSGSVSGDPSAKKEPCFNDVRDRYNAAKEIVSSITSQENLDLPTSPQSRALEWIVCEDEISSQLIDARDASTGALPKQTHGSRFGGDSGEAQVLRRYALAAFHFATSEQGPWNQSLSFLSTKAHECSWHQNRTATGGFGPPGFEPAGFVCHAWEYVQGLPDPPILLDDSAREISWADFKIRVVNNLTGTLPSEFGSLIDIKTIGLEHHKGLYGTLPSTIGNLINLESFSILFSGPNFRGVIPKSLFSIPALKYISLFHNEGVWSFPPTIDSNGDSKLLGVYMANTSLSSTLPPYILSFKELKELNLASNSLEGSIPDFIGKLSSLQYFSVYDNNLSGTLPSALSQLTNLTGMVLGKNSFGGLIPSWIGNLSKLRMLDLGHNKLEGEIPTSFSGMPSLELISLQNNSNLNGSIAPFEYVENLAALLLYSNNFSSSIPPAIFSKYNATGKRIFADFGHNSFTGTLPATFSQWASSISYLSTMKNNFDANAVPDKVCDNVTNIYADCSSCQCCNGDCCEEDSTGGRYSFCDFDLDMFNVAMLECGHWWVDCYDYRYA